MQGDDERLGEVTREGEDVLAVAAAEDPVLVLEQHDVDVDPAEHPGGTHVVAANGLRDRREHAPPLGARRLVHHRDEVGALDTGVTGQRCSDIGRECPDPADTRRVGGDDCRAHGYLSRSARLPAPEPGAVVSAPTGRRGAARRRAVVSMIAARARSSTCARLFPMMSVPSSDSPGRRTAGSCGSQNTGTLRPR